MSIGVLPTNTAKTTRTWKRSKATRPLPARIEE